MILLQIHTVVLMANYHATYTTMQIDCSRGMKKNHTHHSKHWLIMKRLLSDTGNIKLTWMSINVSDPFTHVKMHTQSKYSLSQCHYKEVSMSSFKSIQAGSIDIWKQDPNLSMPKNNLQAKQDAVHSRDQSSCVLKYPPCHYLSDRTYSHLVRSLFEPGRSYVLM